MKISRTSDEWTKKPAMSEFSTTFAPPPSQPPAPRPFQFRLWHLLVAMAVISGMLAVLVPLFRMARQRALRMQSANNLKMIAIALHNYHDTWNSFPPVYHCDAAGTPVHSWRMLITPFIDQGPLYNSYNVAEPWNGPNNSKLGAPMPAVYRSPFQRSGSTQFTSYVAIVGPDTMWPEKPYIDFADVTDGMSNTLLVVEISHSDIHWMEPRDLPFDELEAWLDPQHEPRLGGQIEGGFVAMADGSVQFLPRDVAIDKLRGLATRHGKEYQHHLP
jgi:type II secretory pathway pseudopilin PulG